MEEDGGDPMLLQHSSCGISHPAFSLCHHLGWK